MVEADDLLSSLAALSLYPDQFLGIDVVAVARRIVARISTARDRGDHALIAFEATKQNSATLVGIGLFTVMAKSIVVGSRDFEHALYCRREELECI